jgi:hypothetical protein
MLLKVVSYKLAQSLRYENKFEDNEKFEWPHSMLFHIYYFLDLKKSVKIIPEAKNKAKTCNLAELSLFGQKWYSDNDCSFVW